MPPPSFCFCHFDFQEKSPRFPPSKQARSTRHATSIFQFLSFRPRGEISPLSTVRAGWQHTTCHLHLSVSVISTPRRNLPAFHRPSRLAALDMPTPCFCFCFCHFDSRRNLSASNPPSRLASLDMTTKKRSRKKGQFYFIKYFCLCHFCGRF